MRTCSSILWIESLSGPNSTTSRARRARKRPSDVPPLVESAGSHARHRLHGCGHRVHQRAARRQERLADQRPLQVVAQAMAVEHLAHALLERRRGRFRREPEIEPDVERARNDVAGARPGMDVGNLKAGGLKVRVAAIPLGRHQRLERRRHVVNRVASSLGIGDVALLAVHAQLPVERSAAAVLDRVAETLGRGRLADDARVDGLAARPAAPRRQRRCRPRRRLPRPTSAGWRPTRGQPAARATRSAAVIIAATDAFMSAAPRPYSRPSRSVGVKGSLVHCSIGPGGTTSTWPARQTSGPDDPWRAHRLLTGPRSSRSHRKPAAARRDASRARLPPSAGVTERQAMSCSGELQRLALDAGHVRSSSLIDVLARVCASTRLTMTAHDSEYLPSDDGRLPGTTTEPDGTRPYSTSPVARS